MDNKPVLIQCDYCKGTMLPKEIHMEKTKVLGLSVDYWTCTNCGHVYPFKLTDSRQKVLDDQIKGYTLILQSKRKQGKPIPPAKVKRLQKLLDTSKEYQKLLKDNHLTAVTEQLNKIGVTETNSITGKEEESHEE